MDFLFSRLVYQALAKNSSRIASHGEEKTFLCLDPDQTATLSEKTTCVGNKLSQLYLLLSYRYLSFFQNAKAQVFEGESGSGVPQSLLDFMAAEPEEGSRLGRVSIYNSTNHSSKERKLIAEQIAKGGWKAIFIESVIREESTIEVHLSPYAHLTWPHCICV